MNAVARILIVEDEPALRDLYRDILSAGEGETWLIEVAASLAEGTERFDRELVDLLLLDLRLPDGDGTVLLKHARATDPDVEVLLITAFGSVSSAVEAMKLGAADYLTKPLADPDELRRAVRRALERGRARRHATENRSGRLGAAGADLLNVASTGMKAAIQLAETVAPTRAGVLILGESGTGKEVLARFIHRLSPGERAPFVAVNCAAIPESLIESELFGHERGAFTGAVERRIGRFEQAAGGTLFLDEIGELRLDLQTKLLRVLQERSFERVGGSSSVTTDARILAATNLSLEDEVRAGRFREDLYYRLAVFPIRVPALRHRHEDILPLAELFLVRAAEAFGRPARLFDAAARDRLLAHDYPGNVRELQNVVERAVILSMEEIIAEEAIRFTSGHAPMAGPGGDGASVTDGLLGRLERETILRVMAQVDGNRRRAARVLGISLRTLQYRLKAYADDGS